MSPSAGMMGMRWNIAGEIVAKASELLSQWPDAYPQAQPATACHNNKINRAGQRPTQHQKQHDIIEAHVPVKWALFIWPSVIQGFRIPLGIFKVSYVPWSKHRMNVWSSLLWEPFSSVIIQIPNGLTAMPQDLCVIQVLTMAHMDHGWPADFQSKGYKQPELPEPPNKINYPTATRSLKRNGFGSRKP